MDYLPLAINIQGRPVLVVGGDDIALRKVKILLRSKASVTVVAQQLTPDLEQLLAEHSSHIERREFCDADIQDRALVVVAEDDDALAQHISSLCQANNIWVNVVDKPALCTVTFPAVIDRSPILIALSSGGSSPMLLRKIKAQLETQLPSALGKLAGFLSENKDRVKDKLTNATSRLRFWEDVIDGPTAEAVYSGNFDDAQTLFDGTLEQIDDLKRGEVYLIGAGPGDADLLTFKALRLMQKADVVLHDRLVSQSIIDLCRKDADMIYVGKARSDHAVPQAEINQMLVDLALEGKRVVRLKGGDPFIFGRGGEEIELLAENQIPFQVVPGVTAAAGCAAYSGIPLTHRDYAQSVRFLTAHLKSGGASLDWSEFTKADETLVFYMGLVSLPLICEGLVAAGRSSDTPIALIQKGTTTEQKVITATLATMVATVAKHEIQAPTLIIVGDVVRLRESLAWYQQEEV